ncbi:cAMP-independent regulatory protein pac2 [Gaeumannomyces tritici R3-111a-1]|uniref:cAMP-independent regulatory protein pac2 n=1 Tax=Gaeumannomyces tritici (strain R3-111a-1) TaxID=644352 RepID=J3NKF4_GAET3|nr:cAMP-independent regulatory protein pac2 [Gaeumannomyces tritici R3-111a-1]EJT81768.1 cAMP-independent regulatory protein pac2 [Gaeumannomyces tritici R3-111a-1]
MASPTTAGGGTPPLAVTYEGFVGTTMDALILFEACLQGALYHVPRRPHDRERETLIRSGAVFVYEEHSSGIKRWTDGYNWSPSRILGNFLIYRELEGPFPPGEKKRARKPKKNTPSKTAENARAAAAIGAAASQTTGLEEGEQSRAESERSLIGSLIDSYPFKEGGLVKKTISVQWQGVPHHLVSYYKVDDVLAGKLVAPSSHPRFNRLIPRAALFSQQNFRNPVSDSDPRLMSQFHTEQPTAYDFMHPQGGMPMPTQAPRSMSGGGIPVLPTDHLYRQSTFPQVPHVQHSVPFTLQQHMQPMMTMGHSFQGHSHYEPQQHGHFDEADGAHYDAHNGHYEAQNSHYGTHSGAATFPAYDNGIGMFPMAHHEGDGQDRSGDMGPEVFMGTMLPPSSHYTS